MLVIVFCTVPFEALFGTETGIEKLHFCPASIVPEESVTTFVPDKVEPEPQISVKGKPLATIPDSAALKSVVNVTLAA